MSTPSNSTLPPKVAPGVSSCSRLSARRKVDLPHPDGPISAVTFEASIASDTRLRTLWPLNQQLTPTASSRPAPPDAFSWDASAAFQLDAAGSTKVDSSGRWSDVAGDAPTLMTPSIQATTARRSAQLRFAT